MNWDTVSLNDDYGYIAVFIVYLEKIIDIIKGLFAGLDLGGKKEEEKPAATTE